MKELVKYYTEKWYPLVISLISVAMVILLNMFVGIDILSSKNFEKLINMSIEIVTITIGFMGVLMPIILSMKNDSKLVKYLFEELDKEELFKKYLYRTIKVGILELLISGIYYIKDSMNSVKLEYIIGYVWIFMFIYFLTTLARSMGHMINIIFISDSKILGNEEMVNSGLYTDEEIKKGMEEFK